MKLTQKAIQAIKDKPQMVPRLALALGKSSSSIYQYLRTNDDNLTKAAALSVIREETGLTDDQILEETETARA